MRPGPLRRLVGSVGLLALVPLGLGLVLGRLTAVQAAQRALGVLVAVVVLGRLVSLYLRLVATRFDVPAGVVTARAVGPADRVVPDEPDA